MKNNIHLLTNIIYVKNKYLIESEGIDCLINFHLFFKWILTSLQNQENIKTILKKGKRINNNSETNHSYQ